MNSDYKTRLSLHATPYFLNMETGFSSILHDFPQFPQDMSEQHLEFDRDTSSHNLSSISVAGNHITERCAVSEGDRGISARIETTLRA